MYKSHAYFFGYGSLVNRDTHEFEGAQTATLKGWRRMWRHTSLRKLAYLTVVPDAAGSIDGLIAAVPGDNWKALDLREAAYDRLPAAHQISHNLDHQPEIAVYSIPGGKHVAPSPDHPVLLSYIDVVTQGYMREFGREGAARFFTTTKGWDMPVLDDRAAPIYPRHQTLSRKETEFVDDQLGELSVKIMKPPQGSIWT
jgi:hypothetical protein